MINTVEASHADKGSNAKPQSILSRPVSTQHPSLKLTGLPESITS